MDASDGGSTRPMSLLEVLVDSVLDYAIFALDVNGRVASWNRGAERLKGYRADEVIGRDLATFYTEEDRRAGVPQAALEQAEATGRWAAEGWRVRKDGTRFWASVVITKLEGSDGGHRGFAKVTRDLTDRKLSEDALRSVLAREREAAEQLREVDRIRSDLVSSVAHDLRAPVGVIRAHLDLLRTDWDRSTDDEKQESLVVVAERLDTLASLVDDVFDLVRIDSGHLDVTSEPFDLPKVVIEAVAVGRTAAPLIEVRIEASPDVWAIGDARRTWQVISNLVSNAVKFTAAGTVVAVEVARHGHEVVVAVTDHGPGIAPEQQDLVFERFTRLASASGTPGSGLGLYIARSVAELQGGRIEVDSAPGAGATFRLWLPASDAPAPGA